MCMNVKELDVQKQVTIRDVMGNVEDAIKKIPGAKTGDDCCPLTHTFADGVYIRQITMPKGMVIVSKLHKTTHPYFVLKGDVSVLTEEGVVRIKGPYSGITQAGTKRVLYIHEDTVWTTVHVTKETDLEKIEDAVIAKDYDELPDHVKDQMPKEVIDIDKNKLVSFIKNISELKEE